MKKPIKAREYNLPTKTKRDKLFVKPLKFVKEYLPLIVILPAILGGLWQIIALASMSIAYIRFFSVTQLMADGVLTILVIFPWLVCAYFYNISREEVYVTLKEAKKSFPKIKYYTRKGFIALVYTLIITGIIYSLSFYALKINNEFIKYFGIIPFVFIIIFMLDVIFFNSGFIMILDKIFNSKIFKMPLIFLLSMLFLVFLPMILHSLFYAPRDLENLEKYNQNKNAELLYFNDKYIFIEHKREDNKTTIQVVPFEELFNK